MLDAARAAVSVVAVGDHGTGCGGRLGKSWRPGTRSADAGAADLGEFVGDKLGWVRAIWGLICIPKTAAET